MVRAILDGRKTQTRRIMKQQPDTIVGDGEKITGAGWWYEKGQFRLNRLTVANFLCQYGKVGDRLWVREKCRVASVTSGGPNAWYAMEYAAGGGGHIQHGEIPGKKFPSRSHNVDQSLRWQPSIHMPRWASRITLEITDIRVEQLRSITVGESINEGITIQDCRRVNGSAVDAFRELWESISGKESWDANPWVWVVEFKRV